MSGRLRILHVLEPADGGVPMHVRLLSAGLVDRGHEVWAACRAGVELAPAQTIALPLVGSVPAPREDAAVVRGLNRALAGSGIDLVHAHGQKAGILARPVARARGIPVVYQPNSFVHVAQGRRPRRSAPIRRIAGRATERLLGTWTDGLIAVSREERDVARRERLVRPERLFLVPNGVQVDAGAAPDPRLTAFAAGEPLVGIVAGLRDQKHHLALLDALDRLRAGGRRVRCAIVGDGPLEAEIRARAGADTLVLPFAGKVEPPLAALSVFVLPSLWEGLPLAILEAMAMGVPVIASDVGGNGDAVVDGSTGLLVGAYDVPALADAIARLLDDPAERARMGAAGRARYAECFTAEHMVNGTLRVYEQVLRAAR